MAVRESTHVQFSIESVKLTAQEIEQRVGLKPDSTWVMGAPRGAFGAKAKSHGYMLESALAPNLSYEEHVKEMIKRLSPYAQKMGALAADVEAEFVVILHRRAGPAVDLSRDQLRWLGVIGAKLRFDIQIVSDEPRGGAAAKPEGEGAKGRVGGF